MTRKIQLSLAALSLCLLAAAPNRAAAQTACGTPLAELSKSFTTSDSFGDENFGAGYAATATLNGKRDGLSVAGDLTADASLFGNKQNIVKADASAKVAVVGRSASEAIDVFVMGRNIFHHSRSSGTSDGSGVTLNLAKSWDVTFFSADKRFWLGPVPVKVTATAAGSVGINFDSNIGVLAVDASIKPSAQAFATASASVDAWVASAGVDGRLALINATVPTSGKVNLTSTLSIYWQADSDLALNYLSGQLNVFAKALGHRYEKKIASWPGTTKNVAIVHDSGCINLL